MLYSLTGSAALNIILPHTPYFTFLFSSGKYINVVMLSKYNRFKRYPLLKDNSILIERENEILMGFNPEEDGVFFDPDLDDFRQKVSDGFTEADFHSLWNRFPWLQKKLPCPNDSCHGKYHVVYMHRRTNLRKFLETVVALDRENTYQSIPVFYKGLNNETDQEKLFQHSGFDVVARDDDSYLLYHQKSKKLVYLSRLPFFESQTDYFAFLKFSHPVIGVTGNQSLFQSLALCKLPVWEENLAHTHVDSPLYEAAKKAGIGSFFNIYLPHSRRGSVTIDSDFQKR